MIWTRDVLRPPLGLRLGFLDGPLPDLPEPPDLPAKDGGLLPLPVDELEPPALEADARPVVGDPPVLDGQVEVYVPLRRGGGEKRLPHVRLGGEPSVVVGRELREECVCLLDGLYPPGAELGDQPRLQGAPKPLDPALGLGHGRGDELYAQLLAHPPELHVGVPLYRPVPLGEPPELEDGPPVPVEGLGYAVFGQDRPRHLAISPRGLLPVEVKPHDRPGRVVYGPVQGRLGGVLPEPAVHGRVDLEQLPEPLPPRPRRVPGLLLPGFMPLGRFDPGRSPHPAYRPARHLDPLVLAELLGEVPEVEPLVFPFVWGDDPPLGLGVRPKRARSAGVPVPEAWRPLLRVGLPEPFGERL